MRLHAFEWAEFASSWHEGQSSALYSFGSVVSRRGPHGLYGEGLALAEWLDGARRTGDGAELARRLVLEASAASHEAGEFGVGEVPTGLRRVWARDRVLTGEGPDEGLAGLARWADLARVSLRAVETIEAERGSFDLMGLVMDDMASGEVGAVVALRDILTGVR